MMSDFSSISILHQFVEGKGQTRVRCSGFRVVSTAWRGTDGNTMQI